MADSLSQSLAEAVSRDALVPQEELGRYAVDGLTPGAAVSPSTVEEVSRVLALAARERLAVVPWGGGTQMPLGNLPARADLVLGTGRLNRLLAHEPSDLTATLEGGITLEALQREVGKHGQYLPLDVPLPHRATIGGALATGASGPRRLSYGPARDWLLGVRVVRSDGAITKSGGRVVKNVTGYDLNKLYIGSLGTLGVIVEASFKLAPLPQAERTLVASYASRGAALQAAWALLQKPFIPQALELLDGEVSQALAQDLLPLEGEAALLVSLAGRSAAVARMADESSRVLKGHAPRKIEGLSPGQSAALWQGLTDLGWREEGAPYLLLRASLLPSQLGRGLAIVDSLPPRPFRRGLVAGVGYGSLRLLCWAEGPSDSLAEEARRYIGSLRQEVRALGGHLVVERCPPEVKEGMDVWGELPGGLEVMRRIKGELDPLEILNPGRFVGGI